MKKTKMKEQYFKEDGSKGLPKIDINHVKKLKEGVRRGNDKAYCKFCCHMLRSEKKYNFYFPSHYEYKCKKTKQIVDRWDAPQIEYDFCMCINTKNSCKYYKEKLIYRLLPFLKY